MFVHDVFLSGCAVRSFFISLLCFVVCSRRSVCLYFGRYVVLSVWFSFGCSLGLHFVVFVGRSWFRSFVRSLCLYLCRYFFRSVCRSCCVCVVFCLSYFIMYVVTSFVIPLFLAFVLALFLYVVI